ncbi:MAG: laminin G domain-containing protein, partial [Phycisphaerales bacterium]
MCKRLIHWRALALVLVVVFSVAASGAVIGVDDPSDMADSSGDIKGIEAWVEDGNLNLTMTVYGVFAPSVADTPAGMSNRYYYHWLLDTDNDLATGFSNSEYEGNATNLQTPIGADLVVMFGWRDGNTNGVEVYDPLTEEILFEDYEYTIDGDTIHAVIPLADLGLTPDDTIAVSAFQEGASNDWEVDWLESAVLSLEPTGGDPILVGWWTLNEGSGEMASDMSGSDMHGTINNPANGLGADGSVWAEDADLGTVISFDGTAGGAYVRAGSIPQMTLRNNFTWAFWAKQAPGNGANDIILGNRMDENAVDFVPRQFIKFTPTKFEWHMNGNGDDNMEYEDIPDDVWLHHVVVKTGDQLTYYRNGMVAGAGTITQALDVPQPLFFGGDNEGSEGENWAGYMSDVRIYDGALSQEQVQDIMGGPAPATLAAWEEAAKAARPGFFATNIEDGVYDIGTFGGEMTYEFLVRSNPDEEQASMALIGRRNFGDPQVGLKYEQWNNTGTYGATVFGVADYDYGVATNPGIVTHLTFVSSEEMGTTTLYVDGAMQGSVASAISLSGLVGIGYGAQAEDGSDFFDDFDGAIYGVAVYDRALSLAEIRVNADTSLEKGPSDITGPGDAVVGVPDDGDWPGAETPDLAIDDNVETKYLHFKGDFDPDAGPTGLHITPALGATLVTGLTLTTANDVPGRDPIAFELYGSNDGIDGPYTLIASGDVADFAGEEEWPRFTMNATPI